MAKTINNRATKFLSIAMALSLLLVIAVAEVKPARGIDGLRKAKSTLACASVISVESGDTCSAIIQTFGLTTKSFDHSNPNLNCDALFEGQWLCIDE